MVTKIILMASCVMSTILSIACTSLAAGPEAPSRVPEVDDSPPHGSRDTIHHLTGRSLQLNLTVIGSPVPQCGGWYQNIGSGRWEVISRRRFGCFPLNETGADSRKFLVQISYPTRQDIGKYAVFFSNDKGHAYFEYEITDGEEEGERLELYLLVVLLSLGVFLVLLSLLLSLLCCRKAVRRRNRKKKRPVSGKSENAYETICDSPENKPPRKGSRLPVPVKPSRPPPSPNAMDSTAPAANSTTNDDDDDDVNTSDSSDYSGPEPYWYPAPHNIPARFRPAAQRPRDQQYGYEYLRIDQAEIVEALSALKRQPRKPPKIIEVHTLMKRRRSVSFPSLSLIDDESLTYAAAVKTRPLQGDNSLTQSQTMPHLHAFKKKPARCERGAHQKPVYACSSKPTIRPGLSQDHRHGGDQDNGGSNASSFRSVRSRQQALPTDQPQNQFWHRSLKICSEELRAEMESGSEESMASSAFNVKDESNYMSMDEVLSGSDVETLGRQSKDKPSPTSLTEPRVDSHSSDANCCTCCASQKGMYENVPI